MSPADDASDSDERQHELLLQFVARRYWLEGRSQQTIGQELAYSRVAISRLLDEARRRGVVRIAVGEPFDRDRSAEHALLGTFAPTTDPPAQLRSCRVVALRRRTHTGDRRLLGRHAAAVLAGILRAGDTLAIASSRTVAPVARGADLLPPLDQVIELLGSGRPRPRSVVGAELAEAVGARHVPVPTAFIHRNASRAAIARRRPPVLEAALSASRAHAALLGAGSTLRFDGTGAHSPIERASLERARQAGAVGHVVGVFLDDRGRVIPSDIDELRVGTTLEALRALPRRVLLAWGDDKTAVIRAAIAGGIVTDLVTDDATAAAALAGR